ncbi:MULTISPECIES: hypothetical protein [unclassified Pseudomonas]|uniref:hypothetical protein n=1 Tax=unclassified Pseudomonas TaxID=196821 RepID=UPI000F73A4A7|nr:MULTISPECIES: hypothetical protein [unclassified Pseudomonas]
MKLSSDEMMLNNSAEDVPRTDQPKSLFKSWIWENDLKEASVVLHYSKEIALQNAIPNPTFVAVFKVPDNEPRDA